MIYFLFFVFTTAGRPLWPAKAAHQKKSSLHSPCSNKLESSCLKKQFAGDISGRNKFVRSFS